MERSTSIIDKSLSRYLIIGIPRSSSTAIHLAIKSHPQVVAPTHELKVVPFCSAGLEPFYNAHEMPLEDQRAYTTTDATTTIGAKCTMQTVNMTRQLVETLQSYKPDIRIILTLREDLVGQYGSVVQARKTNIYHVFDPAYDQSGVRPLRLNTWLFTRHAIQTLDSVEMLRSLHKTHDVKEVTYEQLHQDSDAVYRGLFAFLGLPLIPVGSLKNQRVNPPAQDYIRNYQQLTKLSGRLQQHHASGTISFSTLIKIRLIDMAASWKRFVGR